VSFLRLTLTIAAVGAILLVSETVHAHGLNYLHRHAGIGWGDGYHSKTACPPRRSLWEPPSPACLPAGGSIYMQPTPADRTSSATLFPHWDKKPPHSR